MPLFSWLAYAITANGDCLQLLDPPLAQCCFFGASCITACTAAYIGFERKAPFATISFKKEGGLIFEGGPIFGRLKL